MATQLSEETLNNATQVADSFVSRYYQTLRTTPENLHKFYEDKSVVEWSAVGSATTVKGIHDLVMSSDYVGCSVEVMNCCAQSLFDGVNVTVIGCLIPKDNQKSLFSQTFHLAKQEKGYFVSRDHLGIFDAQKILNVMLAAIPSSPVQEPSNNVEAAIDETSEKAKAAPEEEVTDTTAEVPTSPAAQNAAAAEFPIPNRPVSPAAQDNVNESNKKDGSQKITYASMLAKEKKAASPANNAGPKIIRVSPNTDQQPTAAPARVTKERASSSHVSKENNVKDNHNFDENKIRNDVPSQASIAKTIYLQNLPPEITKEELAEALKLFGPVRPRGIQLRTFEDGFCFGFTEFESVTSAKNAVEARNMAINNYDVRISFKKSGPRGGNRAGNLKGRENGGVQNGGVGHRDENPVDFPGRSRSIDRQNRDFNYPKNRQSRDGAAAAANRGGGEAYFRDKSRNNN